MIPSNVPSVTLLFPGQGSQYVGMGKNFLDDPIVLETYQKADKILGYPLSKLCLEGPVEQLKLTENTQPAILTYSLILLKKVLPLLEENNWGVERVLGHSVGEFTALVMAETLSFEDAVRAVHLRGKFMQDAVPSGQGKMVALLKVPEEKVREACVQNSRNGSVCMPANFNDPEQIVISGHASACERTVKWLEENFEGRFRAVELPVSAPFHSSLMDPAAEKLAKELTTIKFQKNQIPYVANFDAKEYPQGTDPDIIVKNLIRQVSGSVLWTQSIKALPSQTLCLEIGPGKILKGLIKKINPEIKVLDMDSPQSFIELKELLILKGRS